jgi:cation-transporting P-type ATPase F
MITGDHCVTAREIARQIDILEDQDVPVYKGSELQTMSDEKLQEAVSQASVFSRVPPEIKLKLVKAFQSKNEVVAMTGDGVNDGPALKQADIGIAMGGAGTEVAKEASDMVLTDDNFASIEAAVEEGRTVYLNLLKVIGFYLLTISDFASSLVDYIRRSGKLAYMSIIGILCVTFLQFILSQFNFMNSLFGTVPVSFNQGLICIGVGFLVVLPGFIIKKIIPLN